HDALDPLLNRVSLVYMAKDPEKSATLNFHLTAREKRDVMASFNNNNNQQAMKKVIELLK
ncbi:MAG TPA: hypothetical protein VIY47_13805, partial [Ignavibacteriaceae bacterium]